VDNIKGKHIEYLDIDGPCPFAFCTEIGPHSHPICPSCDAVGFGNISCKVCQSAQRKYLKGEIVPACVEKRGEVWRVVECKGRALVKNEQGTPVDGGGHRSQKKALMQASAINRNQGHRT
jgi:hypothetical protein